MRSAAFRAIWLSGSMDTHGRHQWTCKKKDMWFLCCLWNTGSKGTVGDIFSQRPSKGRTGACFPQTWLVFRHCNFQIMLPSRGMGVLLRRHVSCVPQTRKRSPLRESPFLVQTLRRKKKCFNELFSVFKDFWVSRKHFFGWKSYILGSLFHTLHRLVNIKWWIELWDTLLQVTKKKDLYFLGTNTPCVPH